MTTVDNKNLMASSGFRMNFLKLPNTTYFMQEANIPGISFSSSAVLATPFKDVDLPGDKLVFGDFVMNFLLDENAQSWYEIWNWMVEMGFPEDRDQYRDLQKRSEMNNQLISEFLPGRPSKPTKGRVVSDGTMIVLNSNQRPVMEVTYKDAWPFSLTDLNFNSKSPDTEYVVATAVIKYSIYSIKLLNQS